MKISMKMNCCHCFLWCRGSLQGPKAGMRWRDPNLFGFDKFSVSDSKLSPSACVFFFLRFFERYKCRWKWGRGTLQKALFAKWVPFFPLLFWLAVKHSSGAQSSAQKGQKVGESFCDFLRWLHPQKSPETFFFYGEKKLRWKRWCEGENWKLCSRILAFFWQGNSDYGVCSFILSEFSMKELMLRSHSCFGPVHPA